MSEYTEYAFSQGLDRAVVFRLLEGAFDSVKQRLAHYRLYLKTEHWKAKRSEALVYYASTCVICDNVGTQIHHRPTGYKFLFREDVRYHLVALCPRCHRWAGISIRGGRPRQTTTRYLVLRDQQRRGTR